MKSTSFAVLAVALLAAVPASAGEVRRFEGHTHTVVVVRFAPDGRTALSGSVPAAGEKGNDPLIRVWDVATGRERLRLDGHKGGTSSAVYSADGTRILSGGRDNFIRLWDAATGKELARCEHPGRVSSVALSPDGRRSFSTCGDQWVRVWDLDAGKETTRFSGPRRSAERVALTPDGKELVVSWWNEQLVGHDPDTGRELRRLPGTVSGSDHLAVSGDGRRVVAVNSSFTAHLTDLTTGKSIPMRWGGDWRAALAPDGRRAILAGGNGVIRLWDVEANQLVRRYTGHAGGIWSLDVSPDGRYALSGGQDHTVRLWDLDAAGTAPPDPPRPDRPRGVLPGEVRPSYGAALQALRMSVKLVPTDPALDVDGNGTVDARDAAVIAQRAAAALKTN